MTVTRTILISRQEPMTKSILRHFMYWSILLGALWCSKTLFGGSTLVEILVLFLAIVWVMDQYSHSKHRVVDMTLPELREWVVAGTPEDAYRWVQNHRNRENTYEP